LGEGGGAWGLEPEADRAGRGRGGVRADAATAKSEGGGLGGGWDGNKRGGGAMGLLPAGGREGRRLSS